MMKIQICLPCYRSLLALFTVLLLSLSWAEALPEDGFVLGRNPIDSYSVHIEPGADAGYQKVSVAHPEFDEAFQIEVKQAAERLHHVNLSNRNRVHLEEGDVIGLRFSLRSVGPENVPAVAHLYVQDGFENYRTIWSETFQVDSEWTTFGRLITVDREFYRNEVLINFFFGNDPQRVEIGGIQAFNLGSEPSAEVVEAVTGPTRRSFEFEESLVPVAIDEESRITGVIPVEFEEDSGWADVTVKYGSTVSNSEGGGRALELDVAEVDYGRVQLKLPGLVAPAGSVIELNVALQSPARIPVRVELRKKEAPYTVYGAVEFLSKPEWSIYEAILTCPETTDPEAVLIFSLDRPGRLAIDDLHLTWLTQASLRADQEIEGNLVSPSSFPLGLSGNWNGGGNAAPVGTYAADTEQLGPSGLPALRLVPYRNLSEGSRYMARVTVPFRGAPGGPHTLSFWAKTESPGQDLSIRMGPPSAILYKPPYAKNVQLTSKWKRYSSTVDLPISPDGYYVARLNTHDAGTFWIDQVMVEASAEAGEFEGKKPVEVSLRLVSDFGLVFDDQTVHFDGKLWGPEADQVDRIEFNLVDMDGRSFPVASLKSEALNNGAFAGQLSPEKFPGLGSFLLEATALDAEGREISTVAESAVHRVRYPRFWGEFAPQSSFGTHVYPTPGEARMAKALGFNWVRLNYLAIWANVEPDPGVWSWEEVDEKVEVIRENDLEILAYLGGIPRRASVASDEWTGGNAAWWKKTAAPRPDALDDYAVYVEKTTDRYNSEILAWETWNEPFLPGFFVADVKNGAAVQADPELFVEISKRTIDAFRKSENGENLLLWNMGAHYGPSMKAFDEVVASSGILDDLDGVTIHKYTSGNLAFTGDPMEVNMDIVREVAGEEPGRQGMIWNSEGGKGATPIGSILRNSPLAAERSKAVNIADEFVRYHLSNFAAGIDKVFSYAFFPSDDAGYTYTSRTGGLLPSAPAISNLAWLIDGMDYTETRSIAPGLNVFVFRGEDRATLALVPNGLVSQEIVQLPTGVEYLDLFGNPISLPHSVGTQTTFIHLPEDAVEACFALIQ